MIDTNADRHSVQARIGMAIVIGLCLMLAAILLVRPEMAVQLMREAMGAL